jgi:hypothetical protein
MLLVLGLFGVASDIALQMVSPCMTIMSTDQTQARLDQTSMVVSMKLERELLATSLNSVSAQGSALSFLAGQGFDPLSGAPIWQQYVIYYLNASTLYRKTAVILGLPSTQVMRLTPVQLGMEAATPNGTEAVVAQKVESFTPTVGSNVTVAVGFRDAGASNALNLVARPRL